MKYEIYYFINNLPRFFSSFQTHYTLIDEKLIGFGTFGSMILIWKKKIIYVLKIMNVNPFKCKNIAGNPNDSKGNSLIDFQYY